VNARSRSEVPVSGAQQVAANGLALLLAYVLPRVFTVVAVVVAARVLGATDFGVYGAAAALAVMLAVVASLGMHPLLVREIAKNPDRAGTLIEAAHRVKTVAALVMLVSAIVLAAVLFPGQRQAQAATLVLSVGWVLQSYAENLSAYFQAVERMRRWTQASALFGLVSSVAGIGLVVVTGSLVAFSVGFTLGWGAALVWLHIHLPAHARIAGAPGRAAVLELARGTAPFAAAFVALTLYCKIDVLLLRHWQGDAQVGLYSAAYKFVDVFQALVIVAAGAAYPRLSRMATARGSGPWAGTRSTELILLAATPAGFALHLSAYPLVDVLYGAEYAGAGAVLSWIGLLLPLLALSLHSGYVLGAAGRILPMAVLYGGGVLLNVALNAWLIPLRGAEGAALARLGSEAVLAGAFLATVGRVAGAAPRLRTALLCLGVAGAAAAFTTLPDPTGGWLRGVGFVALTAAIYAVVGAARPGEAQAFRSALRHGARPPKAGTAP
jgi:O-antigen/teichoic acid export membrane protein